MRTYTVTEYEQEDFDAVKDTMTSEKAIAILEELPDGWFPYRLPSWSDNVTDVDYEMYKICQAIWWAINRLKDDGE